MKLGRRCTTCERRIEEHELVRCETCGQEVHEPCEDYRTSFECSRCADEPAIGAMEF
ncbi:hypothetical protein Htur_2670 [Haloterrigena turkmenica DSM 5511]|uniref:Phorbol-ester/DAG-type domain-containing protein n=1 Tax=Haloterrigena turkmenica (strain ATCC 51198 / DSM 5511 / JCM 9101 / NCIMB 13204 / VKM B-1734 / 4k) TaxID=543526 RepID=D2RWP4_HALTV|nr:hypothetical protein [Haloterrigena turkmenica]ADB61545.1 hypothetical protein Htur_2670 [Haloterrigena turkmenica DSM 5511]